MRVCVVAKEKFIREALCGAIGNIKGVELAQPEEPLQDTDLVVAALVCCETQSDIWFEAIDGRLAKHTEYLLQALKGNYLCGRAFLLLTVCR